MSNSEQKKLEAALDNALSSALSKEGAKNILALLFPKADQVLKTYVPAAAEVGERKRKRRLSQRDFANSYFALTPQINSWGLSEFQTAIKGGPRATFDALRKKLRAAPPQYHSDLRRIFIELLDSEFRAGMPFNYEWLECIIEESPSFIVARDEEAVFLFSTDNQDRLRWLIVNALDKVTTNERAPLLMHAIESVTDLTVLTDVVRSTVRDRHPEGNKDERYRSALGDRGDEVREHLVGRIRQLAISNAIWTQTKPDSLLWFWWSSDNEDEVRAFTDEAMDTPLGLRKLLEITVGTVKSTSGNYERVSHAWSKIVNIDALRTRAEAIKNTADNDADRLIAERFLRALQRRDESSI